MACSAALVFVQSTPLETKLFQKPALEHGMYGGVVIERWHVARLTVLARHFESLKSREDDSVATHAIGVLGYRTTLKVYGIDGLVDPEIAHGTHAKRPLGQGPPDTRASIRPVPSRSARPGSCSRGP